MGLELERSPLLGMVIDWVLGLVLWGCDDDFEDWARGGCGADFVLLRGFEPCKDVPPGCVLPGVVLYCG